MKKFYFILIFLFLFQAITNAASNNVWEKHCIKNQENKEVCSVSTKLTLKNEKQEALGSFVTIDIRYFNYTEKNLNLIDEEKKTYELEEKKIKRPFMIINVPIGIDLRSGLVMGCIINVDARLFSLLRNDITSFLGNALSLSTV